MATQARINIDVLVNELLALQNTGGLDVTDNSLRYQASWGAGTNPAVDVSWKGRTTLTAGAATLALDALPKPGATAINLTGKSVYLYAIRVPAGNALMSFIPAVADGFPIGGDGTSRVVVTPTATVDGIIIHPCPAGLAVTATTTDITVGGTGTEWFDMLIVAGTA